MTTPKFASLNGEIVEWDKAQVHVASAGFKFGTAVFGVAPWSDLYDAEHFALGAHIWIDRGIVLQRTQRKCRRRVQWKRGLCWRNAADPTGHVVLGAARAAAH